MPDRVALAVPVVASGPQEPADHVELVVARESPGSAFSNDAGGAGASVRDVDRAVSPLRSPLAERELSPERAIALAEYHIGRNRIARTSHGKAWRAKHEGVKFLLLWNQAPSRAVEDGFDFGS